MQTFEIISADDTARIDSFLADHTELTRNHAAKLIAKDMVFINGKMASKSSKVKAGDTVTYHLPDPEKLDVEAENIPLEIVYEDEELLVVNKPKGMVVHPAAGNESGTLVNALLYHCEGRLSGINGVLRPGIVHRIDKNTSGLLMVAKTDTAHNFLAEQIKEHSFLRVYEAVVYGNIKEDSGTVNAPIGRHPIKRKQMCVRIDDSAKHAVTHYEVIARYDGFTHVRCKLETGRTHQIRVHMAHIGHPVAGDEVYGPKKVITELGGQCLHAKKLGFTHPATHEFMEFDSELPEYFIKFLEKCERK
ncbi:MAG: RluA family pseudouridine synthase [Clostridiales bacterium]|nr:RluA family pseudouridine synthase [Candidatus Equinaster intestinalis]